MSICGEKEVDQNLAASISPLTSAAWLYVTIRNNKTVFPTLDIMVMPRPTRHTDWEDIIAPRFMLADTLDN